MSLKLSTYSSKILKEFKFPATFFVNIKTGRDKEIYNRRFMNLQEIKLLSKNFTISNYTYSHKTLVSLSKEEIREEIIKAHEIIKESLSIEMNHFCPPGGGFKKEVHDVLKELKYKSISIGTPSFNFRIYKNPYIIERIAVHYLDKDLFKNLLEGKLNLTYKLYKKLNALKTRFK